MKVFRWIKGKPVDRFEKGRLYVVEFWATWCGPCRASIPHLTELAKKYSGKVTFSGISVWETPTQKPGNSDVSYMPAVREFVKSEGADMDYNVGADGPTGTMSESWMVAAGQDGIPTAFVVGRDGKIAWIGHPMIGLDEALDQMLTGKFDYAAERKREESAATEKNDPKSESNLLKPFVTAMTEKRYQDAVSAVDKIIADHPEFADDLVVAKLAALAHLDPSSANAYAKGESENGAKRKPVVLNSIAWAMVDDEDPLPGIDYSLAESIAAEAVALLKPNTRELAETLDTLALAQFKCGKRGDAAATEERAIAIFSKKAGEGDADTLKQMKSRLARYSKPPS